MLSPVSVQSMNTDALTILFMLTLGPVIVWFYVDRVMNILLVSALTVHLLLEILFWGVVYMATNALTFAQVLLVLFGVQRYMGINALTVILLLLHTVPGSGPELFDPLCA